MILKHNIGKLFYPIKKYPSTCIAFTFLVVLISLFSFLIGISDDRGFDLKNYLTNSYIVGDFDSYERSITQIIKGFADFFGNNDPNKVGIMPGPIMPIFILISRFISNNFIPYFIFSIYLSHWVIAFSLDISSIILPEFKSNFDKKVINFKIPKFREIKLSFIEIFGIVCNPILLYYVIFPATDLPFACLVLGIIFFFCKEKYAYCYFFYLVSIFLRPTGLFLFPLIIVIFYFDYRKRKKIRFILKILVLSFTLILLNYYSGYSYLNFQDTLQIGYKKGLSIWGLPLPGWIIYQNGNINILINKISTVLFTPFVQIISVLGIRPSYTTTFNETFDSGLSIALVKPFIYAYTRILWGAIFNIPGLLFLVTNYINFRNKTLLLILIIIFSFGIGLSSSIPLERYLFFAYPILAISSINLYVELLNKEKK